MEAFSRRVTAPAWLDDARAWVVERAEEAGTVVTGPVEQRRVRPWSTQLVAPTDRGPLWFKACCPSMAFEPALHALLADLAPDLVVAPLAVAPERGWMLTAHRGPTLGETREPTLADWRGVLLSTARLQRRLAGRREELLATGLPDCDPAGVPARFDALVDRFASLAPDHPAHLAPDVVAALVARRPEVDDAAALLSGAALPTTLQHGDVHPWNAFEDLRLLDFGDAQWGHPLEVLAVPFGWIATREEIAWDDVWATYAEMWSDTVDPRTLRSLFAASAFTHPVNRALTWWECLVDATAEEWAEWGDAPRHHLLRVLEA